MLLLMNTSSTIPQARPESAPTRVQKSHVAVFTKYEICAMIEVMVGGMTTVELAEHVLSMRNSPVPCRLPR
jgi:hypothetical protein